MSFELAFTFVRIVAASVVGEANQVVVNLRGDADGETDEAETAMDEVLWGQVGIVAHPLPEDDQGAAEGIAVRAGDYLPPMAHRDLRISKARGPIKPGAFSLAGYHGGFVDVGPADNGTGDTVTVYVPFEHNGAGVPAKAHLFMLDPSANNAIALVHALGHFVSLNKKKEILLGSSNGSHGVCVSDAGVTLSGIIKFVGGMLAGQPATAQPVALYPALAGLASAIVSLGTLLTPIINATSATGPEKTAAISAIAAIVTAAGVVAAPATGGSVTLKASPV